MPCHQVVEVSDLEGDVLHPRAFVERELETDHMVVDEFGSAVEAGETHLRRSIRKLHLIRLSQAKVFVVPVVDVDGIAALEHEMSDTSHVRRPRPDTGK